MKPFPRNTLSMLAMAGMLSLPATLMAQPNYPGYGMMMGPNMWQQWTPEQRQQMWQNMHQQGYGPGMMMGPGTWQPMIPEEYKKWWDQTHAAAPEKK